MSSSPIVNQNVPGLTALRFFAASMVFVVHYAVKSPDVFTQTFNKLFARGAGGVTIFFLLSGFLLAMIYTDRDMGKPGSMRKYYVARVARIYPLYLFALVLHLPFLYWGVASNGWGEGLNIPAYIGSKVLMQDAWYFATMSKWTSADWLGQGWTLTCEAVFYALFPFILPLVKRIPTKTLWVTLPASLIVLTVLTAMFKDTPVGALSLRPGYRVFDFVAGMMMAMLVRDVPRLAQGLNKMLWPIVAAILVGHYFIPDDEAPVFLVLRVLYLLMVASIGSAFVLPAPESLARPSRVRDLLVLLGEASYALYLMQAFIVLMPEFVAKKLLKIDLPNIHDGWGPFLIYFVVANIVCIGIYKWFETPLRVWLNIFGAPPRAAKA